MLHAKTVLANELERERRAEYRKFQQQHPPPPPPPAAVELKCTKCASHSPATMWYPISDPPICAGWLTQAVPLSTQPAGPHAVRCAEGPNLRYRTVDGEVLYGNADGLALPLRTCAWCATERLFGRSDTEGSWYCNPCWDGYQ